MGLPEIYEVFYLVLEALSSKNDFHFKMMAVERLGGPMVVSEGVRAGERLPEDHFKHTASQPGADINEFDAGEVLAEKAPSDLLELTRRIADVETADRRA